MLSVKFLKLSSMLHECCICQKHNKMQIVIWKLKNVYKYNFTVIHLHSSNDLVFPPCVNIWKQSTSWSEEDSITLRFSFQLQTLKGENAARIIFIE